jgi:hypothetical protein
VLVTQTKDAIKNPNSGFVEEEIMEAEDGINSGKSQN